MRNPPFFIPSIRYNVIIALIPMAIQNIVCMVVSALLSNLAYRPAYISHSVAKTKMTLSDILL
jgi:hypothetical protein